MLILQAWRIKSLFGKRKKQNVFGKKQAQNFIRLVTRERETQRNTIMWHELEKGAEVIGWSQCKAAAMCINKYSGKYFLAA